ncbi:hypothetical protein [Bifidobacterium aerophilum]|uniref:Uncharacterized protein n=1 Tax=Bifidobacterium aerophilum TaxID=1798155 RepID=A0A6N9Z7W7_9BIFI|nr:hypothetical protein [Bifidobacterium aerophilum]NEG90601.1 hypothetical protein [Bifidobacterium aerophilum]
MAPNDRWDEDSLKRYRDHEWGRAAQRSISFRDHVRTLVAQRSIALEDVRCGDLVVQYCPQLPPTFDLMRVDAIVSDPSFYPDPSTPTEDVKYALLLEEDEGESLAAEMSVPTGYVNHMHTDAVRDGVPENERRMIIFQRMNGWMLDHPDRRVSKCGAYLYWFRISPDEARDLIGSIVRDLHERRNQLQEASVESDLRIVERFNQQLIKPGTRQAALELQRRDNDLHNEGKDGFVESWISREQAERAMNRLRGNGVTVNLNDDQQLSPVCDPASPTDSIHIQATFIR